MWKTVLVGSDAVLTVETGRLCVSRPDKLTRIPIGDVYSVVIDDPRCRISAARRMVNRFMRVMAFFDLPVNTAKKRREYTQFRRYLIQDGYFMLQYSVYARTVRNRDDAESHIAKLKSALPPEGSVRALLVTEKQYENMRVLLGDHYAEETYLDSTDLLEL